MALNLHHYYAEVFAERVSGRVYQKKTLRTPAYLHVLVGLLILAAILFYVWQRVQVVRLGYQIERCKVEKTELIRKNRELLIEISSLTSPDRIERLAASRVGLSIPEREQIVIVKRLAPAVPKEQKGNMQEMVAKLSNILARNKS